MQKTRMSPLPSAHGSQRFGRAGPPSPGNDGGPSEDGPPLPVRFAR